MKAHQCPWPYICIKLSVHLPDTKISNLYWSTNRSVPCNRSTRATSLKLKMARIQYDAVADIDEFLGF